MNAYHNLAGWLRDVKAALADSQGANVNPMSGAYVAQLYDLAVDIQAMFDDGELDEDESDASDGELESSTDELEDGDDAVAVREPSRRSRTRKERKLVGGGKPDVVGRPADVAGDVPPHVQKSGRRSSRRAAPVAAAGKRVKRGTR